MNHRQRMQACLSGSSIDRPPVALWRHFPVDDQNPKTLAESVLLFQETYDFDFVKITPASSFCVRDYGVRDEWHGNPEGTRDFTFYPIKSQKDWTSMPRLSTKDGTLKAQLECIEFVKQGISQDTPFIQTIFDPMSQAKNLIGKENLLVHMREHPSELKFGLERLTENTIAFIRECVSKGIDGIFFAIQHAQAGLLSHDELNEFVIPYDIEIMKQVEQLWLNIVHVHGKEIYFDEVLQIPTSILNWHDQECAPDLSTAMTQFQGTVCGGMKQWDTLVYGSPEQVAREAHAAIKQTHGKRFILGTGCVLPITAPRVNISAVRSAVETGK